MVHTGHTTPSAANLLFPTAGSFVPVFGRFSEQMPEKRRFVPEMGSFSEQTRGSTSGAWRASTPRRNSPAASLPTRCTAGRCPSSCTPAPPPSSAPRRIWPEAAHKKEYFSLLSSYHFLLARITNNCLLSYPLAILRSSSLGRTSFSREKANHRFPRSFNEAPMWYVSSSISKNLSWLLLNSTISICLYCSLCLSNANAVLLSMFFVYMVALTSSAL